ncbi:MAG: DNA-3-methyladenine glycosylase [Phycisphaerae bacterium]|nr:DNA-3-methyladenine glycosylase [Phycisphaerae bacterium]
MTRCTRSFFARSAIELAPALIGTRLVRRLSKGPLVAGRIVEVEAYTGVRDRASHAFGGRRTERNEAMYAEPGTAYIYFTYGMHFCLNVVCAPKGVPEAVLLRAIEPEPASLPAMRAFRKVENERLLCSGPGRLCRAMAIDRSLNGADLCQSTELWLEPTEGESRSVVRSARIGIDYAGSWVQRLLRWSDRASEHLSRPAHGKRSVRKDARGTKNRKRT